MSTDDPLITITDAARGEGIARQVLDRQVRLGKVRSHTTPDGRRMVRLSEVRRDRLNNLAPVHRLRHKREKEARAKRQEASAGVEVPVYAADGAVIAHVSPADVLAEYGGSWDAMMQAADAAGYVPVTLVSLAALFTWLADRTLAALARHGPSVRLDHLGVTVARPDANELLAAYQAGDAATVRELHQRLAPNA